MRVDSRACPFTDRFPLSSKLRCPLQILAFMHHSLKSGRIFSFGAPALVPIECQSGPVSLTSPGMSYLSFKVLRKSVPLMGLFQLMFHQLVAVIFVSLLPCQAMRLKRDFMYVPEVNSTDAGCFQVSAHWAIVAKLMAIFTISWGETHTCCSFGQNRRWNCYFLAIGGVADAFRTHYRVTHPDSDAFQRCNVRFQHDFEYSFNMSAASFYDFPFHPLVLGYNTFLLYCKLAEQRTQCYVDQCKDNVSSLPTACCGIKYNQLSIAFSRQTRYFRRRTSSVRSSVRTSPKYESVWQMRSRLLFWRCFPLVRYLLLLGTPVLPFSHVFSLFKNCAFLYSDFFLLPFCLH